jgi:GMP reductase
MLLNYEDVLLEHGRCSVKSRSDIDIGVYLGKFKFLNPVIMANMSSICDADVCLKLDSLGMFYVYPRVGNKFEDTLNFLKTAKDKGFTVKSVSIGLSEEWKSFIKICTQLGLEIDYVTIDVAFSYSDAVAEMVDLIKELHPNTFIIVGNGNTVGWLEWLDGLGVHAAKVGIGVSPSCRTRQYTGFGSSTVTDLFLLSERIEGRILKQYYSPIENSHSATIISKPLNIKIIADGGLKQIGDIAKAIRFGADMVMSGTLFADCDDVKSSSIGYYGNSTYEAKGYSKNVEGSNVTPIKITEYPQELSERVSLIEDSLRSSVSYSGGSKLAHIRNCNYRIIK